MKRAGWLLLSLLIVATIGLLVWSLTAAPERPESVADDPEPAAERAPRSPVMRRPVEAPSSPVTAPPPVRAAVAPLPAPIAPAGPAVVQGQVLDPNGQPAATAQIVKAGAPDQVVAVSDAQGHFFVPADVGPVVAAHDQFGPSDPAAPKPNAPLILRLQAGGQLTVRVVDAQGRGVGGAQVFVERFVPEPDGPRAHRPTPPLTTDADGSCVFAQLRSGRYDLRATAPEQAGGQAKDVRVAMHGRASAEIRMAAGAVLRGRVTARTGGQPVAGAHVGLLTMNLGTGGKMATTAADGTWELRNVPPGRLTLRVDHPEYRAELVSGVQAVDGVETVRDVQLAARVAGERYAFQGIGAALQRVGDGIVVGNVMQGTPAQQAGLQAGDKVLAVDRATVADLDLQQVVDRIRGEEGSTVLIEVERQGQGRFTLPVSRGTVVVKDPGL